MNKILLISNSEERVNLAMALERTGFALSSPGEKPSAILASATDADGARLSGVLRSTETQGKVPLILAVNSANIHQDSKLLEMADDFILTPLNPNELAFRIRSLIRRTATIDEGPNTITCGDLNADKGSLRVTVGGKTRALSVLEFKLLWFLMQNSGKVVSRPAILKEVWKGTVVSNRTIDAHIVGLRRALQGMQYRIETIYGAGYSLRAPAQYGEPEQRQSA